MAFLTSTRGLRNNNPGNIGENARSNDAWIGEASIDLDSEFEVFEAPEYGIRAIGKVLDSYARRGITSVRDIINTWAPPVENDTDSYVRAVSQRSGLFPNDQVSDRADRVRLVAAIIHHENGFNPFSDEFIDRALALA